MEDNNLQNQSEKKEWKTPTLEVLDSEETAKTGTYFDGTNFSRPS